MDLTTVAEALYSLPVAEFTAERDAQAAAARQSGDRDLATAIKQLRRPTAGAALVNLLVRDEAEAVAALLTVGSQLRHAQEQLDSSELRRLSQQRHAAVAELVAHAKQISADRQQPASEAVLREVRATLDAASADDAAAAELRAGQLTKALQYSGFGGDVPTSTASRATAATEAPKPKKRARTTPAEAPADASRHLKEARTALQDAKRDADRTARELRGATSRADDRRRDVLDLEAQLLTAREKLTVAKRELTTAERAHAGSTRALQHAEQARDKAQRAAGRGST